MSDAARNELAPTGVLRAAVNMSNFLLVTGRTDAGDPAGVSPDMAAAIAGRLGVPVRYVPYPSPGEVADAAESGDWDIGLIGDEPARAKVIDFTPAYVEIESTYLVPAGSPIGTVEEVDRAGVRIAVSARSAYCLWLERNLKNAELVQVKGIDASYDLFVGERLDVLAGLRPRLVEDAGKLPGSRVLEGRFSAVQQAIGTPKGRPSGLAFLRAFVEEAKGSGLVAELIGRHGVEGKLTVAGPA